MKKLCFTLILFVASEGKKNKIMYRIGNISSLTALENFNKLSLWQTLNWDAYHSSFDIKEIVMTVRSFDNEE